MNKENCALKLVDEIILVICLFLDFKKAYKSGRLKVLCYRFEFVILEFVIRKNLVRLIEVFLNVAYRKVRIGKHLTAIFPIKNSLKQGDALSPVLLILLQSTSLGWFG